jgi:tetratricopeptide (TPR) repeat protein
VKAFLSHSSKDKNLVDAVAKHLGRQFSLYDRFEFATGEEFTEAIRRCLDQSEIFVLFASSNSLASMWVKLEAEEAWQRRLREGISKALVYLIDADTNVSSLPEWLQRALVRRDSHPSSIARDIRSHLDELLRERRHPYFVGRAAETNWLEEILTPIDGRTPPHIFAISGLPGAGRRALLRNAVPKVLGFRKFVEIRLEEGDTVNDICLKTADLIEPFSTRADFERTFNEIRELGPNAAKERGLRNLRALSEGGELPVLLDVGGLLDGDGYIRKSVLDVFEGIGAADTAYLAVILHRRPQVPSTLTIPVLQLNPLGEIDAKRLIQRLCDMSSVKVTPAQLSELAEFTAGYPPSAYFATQQAKDYGIDLVLSHKRRLVEFRSSVFLRHIDSLHLNTPEGSVLQLLAFLSPVPLSAIARALTLELEKADIILTRLIDLSLVIPDGDSLYRIAEPIKDSASSVYGFPSGSLCLEVGIAIGDFLESEAAPHRQLDLRRVLFRAMGFGGGKADGIRLASDVIRLTEDYYHAREYERSIEAGMLSVSERPDSVTARGYLIRSLVQLERWAEAEQQLEELSAFAPKRDIHFLRGFLERRRGHYRAAISEYESATRLGRKGASIERELAQCYFMVGDMELANQHLGEALSRHGDNRFVVDLWSQIATERGDENGAMEALSRLEVLDRREFYLYRKSRVFWRFGRTSEALDAINEAIAICKRPAFQFLAQAALCALTLNNLQEMSRYLDDIEAKFANVRRDVRYGLRCRYLLATNEYEAALALSDQMMDKGARQYKGIRLDVLKEILAHCNLDGARRKQVESEVSVLEQELGPAPHFLMLDLDALASS